MSIIAPRRPRRDVRTRLLPLALVGLAACAGAEAEDVGVGSESRTEVDSSFQPMPGGSAEPRASPLGGPASQPEASSPEVPVLSPEAPSPEGPSFSPEAPSPGGLPAGGISDTADGTREPASTGEVARGAGEEPASGAESAPAPSPMVRTGGSVDDFPDARFPRPVHVRGLYLNAWTAGSSARVDALIDVARRTEINTFVIDIKDASGYISHDTRVELAHEIGAAGERRIRDLPALLDRLEEEEIYPIARIVVVKDPILSTRRPEMAVQDTAGGVWIDSKEIIWLNPYHEGVWRYHLEIAREVAEMGFPEIQWDYIRFPDAPASDLGRAVFAGSDGVPRAEAVRGFLAYAREELSDLPVRSTADVFGVTTSFRRDVGIGQLWERLIDVVDVALPMVYPSHYWEGSFGFREPNGRPYEVVRRALRDALRRSETVAGAGLTRPWLQDFSLGEPAYGAAEVRAQIQATYDAGIHEWILWNPSARYTTTALEPVGGFEREPLVRVAGVLTPVSRRHHVIDSVAALSVAPDSTAARTPVPADTAGVASSDADSTAASPPGVPTADTLSVVRDPRRVGAGVG